MCIISITYLGYVQPAGRQRLVEKRRSTYYLYNIFYFGFECVNSTKRGNVIIKYIYVIYIHRFFLKYNIIYHIFIEILILIYIVFI